MGMFDKITCEYPLPYDGTLVDFQTKCLDCDFKLFTITEAGRLIEHKRYYEDHRVDVDWNFHGEIDIYTFTKSKEWFEFRIKFVKGNVVSIKRIYEPA